MYKASGEENLRADEATKSASPNASPSGSGKDMGGTSNLRADEKVMSAAGDKTPTGSADARPSGLQNFDSLAGDR